MYVERIPLRWARTAEDQTADEAVIDDNVADIVGQVRASPKHSGVWAAAGDDAESTTIDFSDDSTPEPFYSFLIPDAIGLASVAGLVLIIAAVVFAWTAWERKKAAGPPKTAEPETVTHKRKKSRTAQALTDATSRETQYATETEPLLEPPKVEKHTRKKDKDREKENRKNGRKHHHRR